MGPGGAATSENWRCRIKDSPLIGERSIAWRKQGEGEQEKNILPRQVLKGDTRQRQISTGSVSFSKVQNHAVFWTD